MIDWNDPAARLAHLEQVGPDAYRAGFAEHLAATVIERRNGRALRYVATRFGRLVAVEATDRAFSTLEQARAYADECAPFDPLAPLTAELAAFVAREGLPAACALELLHSEGLTAAQRRWLSVFVLRWDAVEASAFPPISDADLAEAAEGDICGACDRASIDCSRDPCEAVMADRCA